MEGIEAEGSGVGGVERSGEEKPSKSQPIIIITMENSERKERKRY